MPDPVQTILDHAELLLAYKDADRAIAVLRSKDAPNDPIRCALLARAFYMRGDSKGDVYSSHYFAKRALELGKDDNQLRTICAVAAFRKEFYAEAVDWLTHYVTESSSAASQHLMGLALLYGGKPAEARPWLERAIRQSSKNGVIDPVYSSSSVAGVADPGATGKAYSEALDICLQAEKGEWPTQKRTWIEARHRLGGPKDVRPEGIPSPYPTSPISKMRGLADQPRDMDWLAQNIPCQNKCPAGTDIPEYLSAIYRGDYDRAYRINLHDNVFPAVLGRVCARPCESACRHGWPGLGEPVAICFSKRSAADFKQQDLVVLKPWFPTTGKKVAVVGAGPAGLAAARNLALMGHAVTVYEKHHRPGGMMNQGIPEFRLPRDIIDKEIEQIRRLGVSIVCNTKIGETISVEMLLSDFDAVVLAAGTIRPNLLNIPGKQLKGIRHGLDFLLEANDLRKGDVGEHVVVIGGGFTAMDCARTAARLGAKTVELELETTRSGESAVMKLKGESVKVLYRRSQTEMLITPGELEELNHEGIPMHFMVAPVSYVDDGKGHVRGMKFVRTEMGEPDASGRRKPVEVVGSEFEIPADTVLLATGQFPDTAWIDEALRTQMVDKDQWLKSGKEPRTSVGKIFAAGDFATGAASLINAIGHAKNCAEEVDVFLMGEKRLKQVAYVEDVRETGRIREMDGVSRQPMPAIPLDQRDLLAEVDTGFTKPLAVDETQRCYLCHFKFEIDPDKCIYCDWCIKAKPRPKCIVKISSLIYDEQDRIVGFQEAKTSETTKHIWINQADCIRCGACVEACPVDAISIQKVNKRQVRVADSTQTAELAQKP